MAITIRNEKYLRYAGSDGVSEVVAEIDVDTSDELPAVDEMSGKVLHQGSTAFIVKEGRIVVLAGDGKWYSNGEAVS